MIPVAGRPFIEWPLMQLRQAGFARAVLCTGYRADVVAAHFGDGSHFGLEITYSEDGPSLLGTLGALRRAVDAFDSVVPVLYADTILTVDFAAVVQRHISDETTSGTMTVLRNEGVGDTSNARVDGSRVVAYSKNPPPRAANWIDYGYLVLDRELIAESSDINLDGLLSGLASRGDLAAYAVSEPFHDIGNPKALAATSAWLAGGGLNVIS